MEVGLCGGLKALAAGMQALHLGEHREDGAPASVYLGDDEGVPGCRVVVPDLAPGDPAPKVRGGGVVNVVAGDGPAARWRVREGCGAASPGFWSLSTVDTRT